MKDEDSVSQADQPVTDGARISRRRYLSGVVGGSLLGVDFGGNYTNLENDNVVEIPFIRHGDEVLVRKEVSENWWTFVEKVKRTYRDVESKWKSKPGVIDVNRVASDKRIGGRPVTQLNVEVIPEQYEGGIPDEIDGVDVRVSEWQRPELMSVCQSELGGDFDSMPGGVENAEDSLGTSACRVWDGSKYTMMTVHHLFRDDCDSAYNETLYQNGRRVGPVDTEIIDDDLVLVKDESSTISFSNEVYEENGRIPIKGAATNYDYMMTNYTTVEATGIATGFTNGYVDAYPVDGGGCYTFHSDGVRTTCDVASGDSGAPATLPTKRTAKRRLHLFTSRRTG
jgi:hypothetical protein